MSRRKSNPCLRKAVLGILLLPTAASRAQQPVSNLRIEYTVSGMAPLGLADTFLVAHDFKERDSEPVLGVVSLTRGAVSKYQPLTVLRTAPNIAGDIEAVAAVPDRPGEYLALESGGKKKRSRRLFWIRLSAKDSGQYLAELISPPPRDLKKEMSSQANDALQDVEAFLPIREDDGTLSIYLADRNRVREDHFAAPAFELHGFKIDPSGHHPRSTFIKTIQIEDSFKFTRDWRLCTELMRAGPDTLFMASAYDPGDAGPFRSRIYKIDLEGGRLSDKMIARPFKNLEGVKIEALCAGQITGAKGPESVILFGADNEKQGGAIGVLCPLPPP